MTRCLRSSVLFFRFPRLYARRIHLIVLLALAGVLLSGCAGRLPAVSWAGMTPAGDTLYVAFSTHIYALDLSNGNLRWHYPESIQGVAAQFYAPPAVTEDTVIAGSYGAPGTPEVLVGLDRSSGKERWRSEQPALDTLNTHVIGGIVAQDRRVYVPSTDHRLYALDPVSGTLTPFFEGAQNALWAAPLIVNDTLYLASLDHRLYALSAADGAKLWEFQAGGALAGTPAYADGVLYFGGFDSQVYALDAQTGQARWTVSLEDNWVWGTPAVRDGTVYVSTLAGQVYALDAASGAQKWVKQVGGPVRGGPALHPQGDTLYVGAADGKVYALSSADGELRWVGETAVTTHIYTTPLVVDDLVIIAVNDAPNDNPALVYAFDAATGQVRWKFVPPA